VDLNSERRAHRRFVYEADISHDLLTYNHICMGKLHNFSKGGLYFESDQSISPGEEVFIKFKNQQDTIEDDIMSQLPFGVEIVWQNDLADSFYRFGYGAHYIDINDSLVKTIKIPELEQESLQDKNLDTEKDPRQYPRRQYNQSIRLTYRNKNYRGEFINISQGGVFIRSDIKFTAGNQIKIVFPRSNFRKNINLKGLIVHINTEGFGVKFHNGADLEVERDFERRTGMDRRAILDHHDHEN
jgi:Tfp pilus assembly protein PilZ